MDFAAVVCTGPARPRCRGLGVERGEPDGAEALFCTGACALAWPLAAPREARSGSEKAVRQDAVQGRLEGRAPRSESVSLRGGRSDRRDSGQARENSSLAEYLRMLNPGRLPIATIYFTCKPFPQSDLRTLQVGWSIIFRALPGRNQAQRRGISAYRSPPRRCRQNRIRSSRRPDCCRTIHASANQGSSSKLLHQIPRSAGPRLNFSNLVSQKLGVAKGSIWVKILTGDLRIGLREGLVEEAIASGLDASRWMR